MSELKAYRIKGVTFHDVYLKSEADKVIAELEEKLKNSRNARKYWRNEYLIEYKECHHSKYKRCLAMAAKYLWKRNYWRDSTPAYERQLQWENMAYKHYKRWLELAEKFKEAK